MGDATEGPSPPLNRIAGDWEAHPIAAWSYRTMCIRDIRGFVCAKVDRPYQDPAVMPMIQWSVYVSDDDKVLLGITKPGDRVGGHCETTEEAKQEAENMLRHLGYRLVPSEKIAALRNLK